MAMMCLKEFDRMGIIQIEGFVANLMPAERRALFGRGALDSLGCPDLPIAKSSVGDAQRQLNNYLHEFDNTEDFIAAESTSLLDGQDLLTRIFTEKPTRDKQLTVLTNLSLMNIAQFSQEHKELLRNGMANEVLQGDYRIINDKLVPDSAAANNTFDLEDAATFHKFMQDYDIPSTAWTKSPPTPHPSTALCSNFSTTQVTLSAIISEACKRAKNSTSMLAAAVTILLRHTTEQMRPNNGRS